MDAVIGLTQPQVRQAHCSVTDCVNATLAIHEQFVNMPAGLLTAQVAGITPALRNVHWGTTWACLFNISRGHDHLLTCLCRACVLSVNV